MHLLPNLPHRLSSITHNRTEPPKLTGFLTWIFSQEFASTTLMPMTASSEKMVLNQLPQPARPSNSYDTILKIPSTTYPLQQQAIDENYGHVVAVPPSMPKEEEGQRKFALVSKLVNHVFDKYEKLPASFRDQINVEEMLSGKRKRHVEETQNTTSRGLQQPVQEKPERFKVRYVSTEEAVKDDDKK